MNKHDDFSSIRKNLIDYFDLPEVAVDWLHMVWNMIQVFDDVYDKDYAKIDAPTLNKVIYDSLGGQQLNPFFSQYHTLLSPLLSTMVFKWNAANFQEQNHLADERSFVWRAGYYDLILMVHNIVHGAEKTREKAHFVLQLYGESFKEYIAEFRGEQECQAE